MSCPWIENREVKAEENTTKYAPLREELKERYPGYQVTQYNIIIDVLGGYLREVKQALKELVGDRSNSVPFKMQKSVLSSSLRIAKSVKILNKTAALQSEQNIYLKIFIA